MVNSFLPYLRLTAKIFQFLRLSTKFLAVLRVSVNPIETLLQGLGMAMSTAASEKNRELLFIGNVFYKVQ